MIRHLTRVVVGTLLTFFCSSGVIAAATITLAWDPSPSTDVIGYIVSWRAAGATVGQSFDVGNVTTYAVRNLTSGTTYTFSVRAYNAAGVQSAPSAEVSGLAYVDLTLTSSPSHLAIGQSGTWSARATGFDGPVEFEFHRYSAVSGWQTVRSYSTSASYAWTPTASNTGLHMMEVVARHVGSAAPFEAKITTAYFSVGDASPVMVMPSRVDFDADGRADLGVYRPSAGMWYVLLSSAQYAAAMAQNLGTTGDVPTPGDYDGDGRTDFAVFRPSTNTWYVLRSDSGYTMSIVRGWGMVGDIPVPADYDGDGRTDIAVFRPSTNVWYVLRSDASFTTTLVRGWGAAGDVPVPADYDGDRRADFAVFRPSNSAWYVLESITGYTTAAARGWGMMGDRPTPADYDGDHRADFAVYRPSTSTWYVLESSTGYTTVMARGWGMPTDLPVPGDYSGIGRAEIAVFRPATATWFVLGQFARTWGMTGDIPLLMK
ncbi:MAG TPA: FG-GAP-like repeat-containing protein [Vicinamibacterales bacterium]|nr:FG-GAP-like repeat-containing protein [Vicinamibacterales bacterium]